MPHSVLPQLVDALQRNIELYRSRWGELPSQPTKPEPPPAEKTGWGVQYADPSQSAPAADLGTTGAGTDPGAGQPGGSPAVGDNPPGGTEGGGQEGDQDPAGQSEDSGSPPIPANKEELGAGARQASAQEVYDDLKIRDELLSGAYANAVMIGHGPHEFSFDFITNFYPHSAVSSRVFLAAGQIPRLYDSLKGTWDQLRRRMRPPGDGEPPVA
ncbi:MAG TPA: hypothetical protein DDW52_11930 [Planctomycetaceae bacterium]|nr:hypothetical protein [Planctomycetaceae bacterium]